MDAKLLRELMAYEPETGVLTWRVNPSPKRLAGKPAGGLSHCGYIRIGVQKRVYYAHRLAWLWVNGEWPKHHIDHINGICGDNRIANLRDVPRSVNLQNQHAAKSNSRTGLLGASPSRKRYVSTIKVGDRTVYMGSYDTAEEAHCVYLEAKRRLHEGCTI